MAFVITQKTTFCTILFIILNYKRNIVKTLQSIGGQWKDVYVSR